MLKFTHWKVLYRKINNNDRVFENINLLNDFKPLPNLLFYWVADPFPINVDSKQYIFAELGNKITGKGTIGYICLNDKKPKWKKCISNQFHMSFPNVFEYQNEIYMIPETFQDGCVSIYHCTLFPTKWEKKQILFNSQFAVDSIFIKNNRNFIFSYESKSQFDNKTLVIRNLSTLTIIKLINDTENVLRPAGNGFIHSKNKIYIPTQNCSVKYGEEIIFHSFDINNAELFEISKISPCYIKKMCNIKNIDGCHTYNFDENIEVIDIRYQCFSILSFIGAIFYKLSGLFKKK